jgi:hypothetical protein
LINCQSTRLLYLLNFNTRFKSVIFRLVFKLYHYRWGRQVGGLPNKQKLIRFTLCWPR